MGVINISLEMAEEKIREPEEKSTNIIKLKREKKKLEKKWTEPHLTIGK